MRITSGTLKNRIIKCPKGTIRPAMDRMRLSIFSILEGAGLSGSSFLDLFSGSGICALEAASRGASSITLVEKDAGKFGTILENVSISSTHIECKRMACELFIKRNKTAFDFIYIDPPFPYEFHTQLLESIATSNTSKVGTIILMHRPREKVSTKISNLEKIEEKKYGRSIVDFYKKITETPTT